MKVPTELLIKGGFNIFLRNYIHLSLDVITQRTDDHPEALIQLYERIEEQNERKVFDQSHRLTLEEYQSIKSFYYERNDRDSFRNFVISVIWTYALPVDFNDWLYPFTSGVEEYTIRSFYEKWIDPGYGYPS